MEKKEHFLLGTGQKERPIGKQNTELSVPGHAEFSRLLQGSTSSLTREGLFEKQESSARPPAPTPTAPLPGTEMQTKRTDCREADAENRLQRGRRRERTAERRT